MSQLADNFDRDLDQGDEILNAMGLREDDFTHFTAMMKGIDALADSNNSNQLSFSDLFLILAIFLCSANFPNFALINVISTKGITTIDKTM